MSDIPDQGEMFPVEDKDQGLSQRLNRREIKLVKSLDDMACSADDDIPLFWFKKVFTDWISPQSEDRKCRVRFVLEAAVKAIKSSPHLSNENKTIKTK